MLLQPIHLYDLSVLGLHWLSEVRDIEKPHARSLLPILYVLRDAGLITEKQRKAAMSDPYFRHRVLVQLYLCQDTDRGTRQEALASYLREGGKHLAVMLPQNIPYDRTRVLAKNGYQLYLTQSGQLYAQTKEGPYESILSGEAFIAAWLEMKERVQTIARVQEFRRPKAVVLEGTFGAIELRSTEFETDADSATAVA